MSADSLIPNSSLFAGGGLIGLHMKTPGGSMQGQTVEHRCIVQISEKKNGFLSRPRWIVVDFVRNSQVCSSFLAIIGFLLWWVFVFLGGPLFFEVSIPCRKEGACDIRNRAELGAPRREVVAQATFLQNRVPSSCSLWDAAESDRPPNKDLP